MTRNKADFIELFRAYLADMDLTSKQLIDLESALKDPRNIQLLEELMDSDLERAFLENKENSENVVAGNENSKVALLKILEKLTDHRKLTTNKLYKISRSYTSLKRWSGWAAAILLLGLCAVFFNRYRSPTTTKHLTKARHDSVRPILPGSSGAILTLANGHQILLDSTKQGLVNIGSTTLLFDSGQINYTANQLSQSKLVEYNLITTPRGRQYQLKLADGTKVWLNASSSLRFPSAFDEQHRTVELTGEAYFEVVHNATSPFQVKVKDQLVEDIGTHFNINAYDNGASKVKTTLLEGAVTVSSGKQHIQLKPGEQAQIVHGRFALAKVDANDVIAWKSGYFLFSNASVREILQQISRWYDVDVEFRTGLEKMDNTGQLYSGKIDRTLPLKDLLDGLQFSRIHFKIDSNNRRVIVKP